MMSPSACTAIHWLFEKSVRETSILAPEDNCIVSARPEMALVAEGAKRKLVVLNISSYVFRIVALFDFGTDEATTAYLARKSHSTGKPLEGQALLDAYAEFVNMICGAFNRGLGTAFPAGMSTPFFLESSCARYVSILDPSHVASFEVAINDSVRFSFTVCICVASDTELDFDVDRSVQEEESSGVLELF
ncbi:MAG: hypothetical protein P4L87_12345 [Formivibrio sp.]|nr:hypothetical protein [Formivibrio sp.]